jgi:hypothetical protein
MGSVHFSAPIFLATLRIKAIAIGVLANTLLKLAIAIVVGVKSFRKVVLTGLSAVALASAISLV